MKAHIGDGGRIGARAAAEIGRVVNPVNPPQNWLDQKNRKTEGRSFSMVKRSTPIYEVDKLEREGMGENYQQIETPRFGVDRLTTGWSRPRRLAVQLVNPRVDRSTGGVDHPGRRWSL